MAHRFRLTRVRVARGLLRIRPFEERYEADTRHRVGGILGPCRLCRRHHERNRELWTIRGSGKNPVSYTHLTLATNREV